MSDFDIRDKQLYKCPGDLNHVVLPDGITSISENAFQECKTMETLVIPSGVYSIEADLSAIGTLKAVYAADVRSWLKIDFSKAPAFPLQKGVQLFLNEQPVTDLVIPVNSMIGDYAFYGCTSLKRVTFEGDWGCDIGDHAFGNCSSLEEIVFSENVTRIGTEAFDNCGALSVHVPPTVMEIGLNAFRGVRSCDTLLFLAENQKVPAEEFDSVRPELLTICDKADATVEARGNWLAGWKTTYLRYAAYPKEVYERILKEAGEWYVDSLHSVGSDYGYGSSDSENTHEYLMILSDQIIAEDGHFAGIAERNHHRSYMKGFSKDDSFTAALIKKWKGEPLPCSYSGSSFGSDDHESWDTTTHYLCRH